MAKFPIVFHDIAEIAIPNSQPWMKGGQALDSDTAQTIKSLRNPRLFVRMKATNSGTLINRRVYPGPRMQNSVDSWLDHYGKPILEDHPSRGGLFGGSAKDPAVFGRVTEATYTRCVDESTWETDWQKPLPAKTDGSGYITLGGFITDRNAIDGVLDNRLLTMSVGSVPDAFFCSICKQDWLDAGPCGHEFGKVYELDSEEKKGKFLAYGVTGNLNYDHIAFVNTPADVKAQVLEMEMQDSELHPYFNQEMDQALPYALDRLALVDADGTCVEMQLKPSEKQTVDRGTAITLYHTEAVADLHAEVGPSKGDPMSDNANQTPEETAPQNTGEEQAQEEEAVEVTPETSVSDPAPSSEEEEEETNEHDSHADDEDCEECAPVWTDEEVEEWPLNEAEDIEEEWTLYSDGVYAQEDKPLSTKQRKNIPTRLFCGPERSFPVPDAPRVRNALARLGQGFPKGASSSTKAKIRACVMRRAKQLGVETSEGSGKADTVEPTVPVTTDTVNDTTQTIIDTLSSEVARKKSEIVRLSGALEDKTLELDAMRDEMEVLQTEYRSQVVDRVIDLKLALRKPDVREAQDSGKLQEYRDELVKRNLYSLLDSAHDLQLELAERGPIGSSISPSDAKPDNPTGSLGVTPEGEGDAKDKLTPKQRTLAALRGKQD